MGINPLDQCAADFLAGYNCSQSVVRAFAAEFDLDPDIAVRVATAFGGGMGRTGRVCGAVSGALMVLGLRYGNALPTDKGAKEATYTLARRFMEAFAARHGSVDCPALLGCDISTPQGLQSARQQDLFNRQCPEYVKDAVRMLVESGEKSKT